MIAKRILENIKSNKILIIGESIKDVFIPVEYQGNSMKSFCSVVREISSVESSIQSGGAAVIQRHLQDFVEVVDIITNDLDDIVKSRYYDIKSKVNHFEINKFNLKKTLSSFKINYSNYDLIIIADFGHGFVDKLDQSENMCFMAQTNSHNFGYNRISKWKEINKKYVCIDHRESKLQLNDNSNNNFKIQDLYKYEMNTQKVVMTNGKKGGIFFDGDNIINYKSFTQSNFIDSIGAGDTFYAFSSLFLNNNLGDIKEKLDLASLFASLTTEWRGNEYSITKSLLKKKNVI